MTTFEIKNSTVLQRETLRKQGFKVERLDGDFSNVECFDLDHDIHKLEKVLEDLGIEYRLV